MAYSNMVVANTHKKVNPYIIDALLYKILTKTISVEEARQTLIRCGFDSVYVDDFLKDLGK